MDIKEERLIYALAAVNNVLTKMQIDKISNKIQRNNGSVEEIDDCLAEIGSFINQYIQSRRPLTYTDLIPGKWIWDNKLKWFFKVISGPMMPELYGKVFYVEDRTSARCIIDFENNRYFPVIF